MNKNSLTLIRIGGITNVLMTLFHVFLCITIHRQYGNAPIYPLLQMFAVSGTIMIAFLAFSSLAYSREMATTQLGFAVLALNLAIYLGRAIGEIVLFPQPKPLVIGLCLIIALLYAAAAATRRNKHPA